MADTNSAPADLEAKRSAVRRLVTYWWNAAYLVGGLGLLGYLVWAKKYEMALGVFAALGTGAGNINGFWYGSRKQQQEGEAK